MKVSKILDHLIQDFQGTDDGLLAQRREEDTKRRRDEETKIRRDYETMEMPNGTED